MTDSASLWRHPDFLKLWAAKTVSDFGSLISGAALSFTAIIALKATPFQLGLLAVSNLLPRFLAGLAAGVWVDRLRRRPLMVAADIGRAVVLLTIPAAAALGLLRIEQLYVVAIVTGLLSLLFDVADRSYLPTLIPRADLIDGNSKLTASSSVAEFSAFSLAGWLVQWISGPMAVLVDSLSFICSAAFIGSIRSGEDPPAPQTDRRPLWLEASDGLKVVRNHRVLFTLAITTLMLGFFGSIVGAVIAAFMVRDLGFKPGILGMIWAVGGIGSLCGAAAAGKIARWLGMGRTLAVGILCAGLGYLIVPLAHGATIFAGLCLLGNQLITDPGYTIYEINQVSLRQSLVPDSHMGRVNATFDAVHLGAGLLGALAGGLLGGWLGLRWTLIIGGGGHIAAALFLWTSSIRSATGIDHRPSEETHAGV